MYKALKRRYFKDEAGFSLVELIVVIAIMVILISILTPGVIGYIEKANRMRALETAKVIVNGMELALVDHALENEQKVTKLLYRKEDGQTVPVGCITNYFFYMAQKGETYRYTGSDPKLNDEPDYAMAKEVLEACHSEHGAKNPVLRFEKKESQMNKSIRDTCKGKYDAILFAYAPGGGVYFAEICLKGTYLVTYENGEYEVENVKQDTTRKFSSRNKVYATDNANWGK